MALPPIAPIEGQLSLFGAWHLRFTAASDAVDQDIQRPFQRVAFIGQ